MKINTHLIQDLLDKAGLNSEISNMTNTIFWILLIALVAYFSDIITKKIIIVFVTRVIRRSKSTHDDIFLRNKVFRRLSHLAPALVIHFGIALAFPGSERWVELVQSGTYVYMLIIGLLFVDSFINSLHQVYMSMPISRGRSIKGYVQVVKLFFYCIGIILILSIIMGESPKGILAGLGALAAVLILVFKDTILGFVASIQLAANQMVKPGDWISMPSHNADGIVSEITLNTVKVQNWDKTISMVPTYALVSDSFYNWRGMEESGGRRIKRSVNIDIKSIKVASPELIAKLKRIHFIKGYIEQGQKEIEEYNQAHNIDDSTIVNGRRMTNIGIFRRYVEAYLRQHPKVHNDMTFLVRHLQPTEKGLPLEVYVFSREQEWAKYESLQADVFDHLLAVLPEFELKAFQNPSGDDFRKLMG